MKYVVHYGICQDDDLQEGVFDASFSEPTSANASIDGDGPSTPVSK